MRRLKSIIFILILLLSGFVLIYGQSLQPFSQIIKTGSGKYNTDAWQKVPVITWGADIVTIKANGGKLRTVRGSAFDKQNIKVELFREDDFRKQVERYLKGEINFLRGTMGMINMAADVTEKNPASGLVVIYQHSWSAGGDALVVKQNIKSVKDLRGKTIAIQKYGPHVDYLMKLLNDGGLSMNDIKLVWTKDFIGPVGDTPMAQLYKNNVDAAFVIIPDALALTSDGTVGTGAEDSVKGAKILLSTKTANRIISDVYAVRNDYFRDNKAFVKKFVHALLQAEEDVKKSFKNSGSAEHKRLLSSAASILLDSPQATEEAGGLYFDAEITGFDGNVKFFTDRNYPRNFTNLNREIQNAFISLGLLKQTYTLNQSNWNYNELKGGLANAGGAASSRFDQDAVSTIVTKKQQQDTIDDSSLFSFKIFFKPNQNTFSIDMYKKEFDQVISLASTYGGAVITVEGHSDPMGYLRKQKDGASQIILNRIKQSAKNLSYSRGNQVKDEIIKYATSLGISLDPNQFAIVGHGITTTSTLSKFRSDKHKIEPGNC